MHLTKEETHILKRCHFFGLPCTGREITVYKLIGSGVKRWNCCRPIHAVFVVDYRSSYRAKEQPETLMNRVATLFYNTHYLCTEGFSSHKWLQISCAGRQTTTGEKCDAQFCCKTVFMLILTLLWKMRRNLQNVKRSKNIRKTLLRYMYPQL